ncbi:MAG: polyprenyl diphosphate synthase [Trueperaceae bacterium]|nr:polyprenyl diphosphate synthase [Trueperaceae bacterium]
MPDVAPPDASPDVRSGRSAGPADRGPAAPPAAAPRAGAAPGSLRAYRWFRIATAPLYWAYERRLERRVRSGPLPQHMGIIMDGNRRFARLTKRAVQAGHDVGASKAHEVLDWCLQLGIPTVTLWGFSSDNAGRSPEEVAHLHALFAEQARSLADDPRLTKHRVRVRVIGDIGGFSEEAQEALRAIQAQTEHHDGMHLNLALGYGGREEIVAATRALLERRAAAGEDAATIARTLDADAIAEHLWTSGLPDPDFVIRTSGEVRSSGFLLWQAAYAEFYFIDAFWPDFRRLDFLRALRSFQARERRFGR